MHLLSLEALQHLQKSANACRASVGNNTSTLSVSSNTYICRPKEEEEEEEEKDNDEGAFDDATGSTPLRRSGATVAVVVVEEMRTCSCEESNSSEIKLNSFAPFWSVSSPSYTIITQPWFEYRT